MASQIWLMISGANSIQTQTASTNYLPPLPKIKHKKAMATVAVVVRASYKRLAC